MYTSNQFVDVNEFEIRQFFTFFVRVIYVCIVMCTTQKGNLNEYQVDTYNNTYLLIHISSLTKFSSFFCQNFKHLYENIDFSIFIKVFHV